MHQKKPPKIPPNLVGCCLDGGGWIAGDDGCLRLEEGGVRPPAGRPVPPGESRTIVTSIGVVGHSGEVREIALSSPRQPKKCSRGPMCLCFLGSILRLTAPVLGRLVSDLPMGEGGQSAPEVVAELLSKNNRLRYHDLSCCHATSDNLTQQPEFAKFTRNSFAF